MRDEVWVLPLRGRVVLRLASIRAVKLEIEHVRVSGMTLASGNVALLARGLDALGEPPRLAAKITRGVAALTSGLNRPGALVVESDTHGGGASISGSGLADSSAAAIR
jgi:hypothetical protein